MSSVPPPPPPPPPPGPPPPPYTPPPGYQPYGGGAPQRLKKATQSMVFGILGLLCCPLVFSILAIVFGNQAKAEIDAAPGAYNNKGQAQAGYVMGIIGLVLWVILIIIRVAANS